MIFYPYIILDKNVFACFFHLMKLLYIDILEMWMKYFFTAVANKHAFFITAFILLGQIKLVSSHH